MSKQKSYKENQRFVINMTTGAHGLRTEVTDTLPLTFKIITDETCTALCKGTVTGMQVVEAIKRGFMTKPDFSWEEYDRRRQEEKFRMNVSQHDMVPVTPENEAEDADAEPAEVYDLASLGLSGGRKSAAANEDNREDCAPANTPAKSAKTAKKSSVVEEALGSY